MAEEIKVTPDVIRAVTQELGRQGAASRQQVAHTCPVCGTEFVGIKKARYCSDKCRVQAFYDANRERVVTEKRERRRSAATTASPGPAEAPAGLAQPVADAPAPPAPAPAGAAPDASAAELRELVAEGRELLAGVGARLAADASPAAVPAVLPAPSDPSEGGRSSG